MYKYDSIGYQLLFNGSAYYRPGLKCNTQFYTI